MKNIVLIFLSLFMTIMVNAQENFSWTIKHDKKQLLTAAKEDAETNVITLQAEDLKANKKFCVTIKRMPQNSARNLVQTIAAYTESDKELYRKDVSEAIIPDSLLMQMLVENKIVKFYTWALPKDPAEAARVRVRRVHLCTIKLSQLSK